RALDHARAAADDDGESHQRLPPDDALLAPGLDQGRTEHAREDLAIEDDDVLDPRVAERRAGARAAHTEAVEDLPEEGRGAADLRHAALSEEDEARAVRHHAAGGAALGAVLRVWRHVRRWHAADVAWPVVDCGWRPWLA